MGSRWHDVLTKAEELLLGRTLVGRRLDRPVVDRAGVTAFAAGVEIDRQVLDRARELDLLEELAAAAQRGTSDSELEDLLRWIKSKSTRPHGGPL